MELVKYTPEEQAAIDADKASPFVVVVIAVDIDRENVYQTVAARLIADALLALKERADRARMIILDRNISTNLLPSQPPFRASIILTIIGQWAEVEKIEEMNRRQAIANAAALTPGRRGA
jgi:hypothetical protein